MPDPAERFLAAATAPLGDNAELQVMARRELEGCLVDGGEEALEEATVVLEKGKPRRGWKIALYAVTAVVSIVSLGVLARLLPMIPAFRTLLSPFTATSPPSPAKMEARLGKGLNTEQRLLLFGDTSKTDPAERYKALWTSDPENPAFFADYALHYIDEHDRLPSDFLETADKLDPDNAWFTVVAAGVTAKNSVKRNRLSPRDPKDTAPGYTILDQSRMDEAVELLKEAARKSRFESYQQSLMAERIAHLPPRTDFSSQLSKWLYLGQFPSDSSHFMPAYEVADAAAWQAEDAGDSKAFLKIVEWWEPNLLNFIKADALAVFGHGLIARATLGGTARRYTATSLPETDDLYASWEPIFYWMQSEGEDRSYREIDEKLRLKGGMVAGMILPITAKQTREAPRITDADLKPGRMVDHELFARVSAAVVWLLFGLILLAAALYRHRASLLVRRISGRLEDLLKPVDWAGILGAGVVLPFLFYLAIYRLTPLGARDWSIAASAFIVPAGQVASMGFLMIVLPVLVARWRLGKRGAMLGWRDGDAWMGWTGVACGVLALPIFGSTFMVEGEGGPVMLIAGGILGILLLGGRWLYGWRYSRSGHGWMAVVCGAISLPIFGFSLSNVKGSEAVMMIAAALLGILVLTGLIIGIRAVFSKRPALLRRVTLSRVLVPAYALGMLLMAASMPLYHAAEKRWLAQDRLMEITPEAPALSRYEWEVAQAMRAELLEILNTK